MDEDALHPGDPASAAAPATEEEGRVRAILDALEHRDAAPELSTDVPGALSSAAELVFGGSGELPAVSDGQDAPSATPRALRTSVAALATLCLLLVGGAVVASLHPAWLGALRDRPRAVASPSVPPTQSVRASSGAEPRGTTAAPGRTQGGSSPSITAVQPSAGAPGQQVIVNGNGILSSDGQIVATFGSRVAPTRCPTEHRCVVQVPPGRPSSTVLVRIRTAQGASNAVAFRYLA